MERGHGAAIWIWQAGSIEISHNRLQEGPRDAVGVYGVRFGSMKSPIYSQNKTFWTCMDALFSRHIEVSYNQIKNAVRDTSDAGALEYWGVGNNSNQDSASDIIWGRRRVETIPIHIISCGIGGGDTGIWV